MTDTENCLKDLDAGDITGEDILNVLPFNNTVDLVISKLKFSKWLPQMIKIFFKIVINGTGLMKILENSISRICPNFTCHPGLFLQVKLNLFHCYLWEIRDSFSFDMLRYLA